MGQQVPEQLVAGQEPEQVQRAVLLEVAGRLLLRVDAVDRFFEPSAVLIGQDVANKQEALLKELFTIRVADRLVAGQVAVVGGRLHFLPLHMVNRGWA